MAALEESEMFTMENLIAEHEQEINLQAMREEQERAQNAQNDATLHELLHDRNPNKSQKQQEIDELMQSIRVNRARGVPTIIRRHVKPAFARRS